MPVDHQRSIALVRKLDQLLAKTHAKPLPERVHQIRTTARRLEALLDTLHPHPDKAQRKLRKRLKRLRRGAGCVRDIDVQILALRKLKIGREQQRKARLMQALNDQRAEREQELIEELAAKSALKTRKGLQKWGEELIAAAGIEQDEGATSPAPEFEPVMAALRAFSRVARDTRELTPENLHGYRTQCKRIRYVAEMAGDDPAGRHVVDILKRSQDAIGDWHDWVTLTATAESLFARSLDSALISALRNVTHAKFSEASAMAFESRRHLLASYRALLARRRAERVPQPEPRGGRRKRATRKPRPATVAAPAEPQKAKPATVGSAESSVA
ncbi:MAG: CHAD domain-containing protein [Terriglobales bacterium]